MIHFLFLKWMKDSRGKHAKVDGDENEYPCIKVFSTVDAPIEDVSEYLSEVSHMEQYNDLVMAHREQDMLESVSTNFIHQGKSIEISRSCPFFYNLHSSHLFQFLLPLAKRFCDVLPSPLEERWNTNSSQSGM